MTKVFLGNIDVCKNIDFDSFPHDVEVVLTDNFGLTEEFGIIFDDDFFYINHMTIWEYISYDLGHKYKVNGKYV